MTKQAAATVFAVGETPQLWVDGVNNPMAVTPGAPTGVTSITDTLELGRGGRPTNPPIGYFKGRCSFLALSSRRQPDEVLRTMTAAFADPVRVCGHGSVNLQSDTVRSPVAMLAETAGAPGSPVTVNVAAASYDPGGLALTCSAASLLPGSSGNVTRSGGNVTITPNSDAKAGDLIAVEYTIRNSGGKTSSSRVYLTVSGVVIPAVQANPNGYTATVGVTAPYSPLTNDTPSTGVTITAIGTPSAGGTASIILPGRTQISYTPRSTAGTETLSYTMSDGHTSSSAVITFTVSAAALPVQANLDSYTATAGVTATYSPLTNDTPSTGVTITAIGTLAGGSTASRINSNTQISYSPRSSSTNFTESLSYTISDGTTSSTSTITFTVAGVVTTSVPKLQPAAALVVANWRTVGFTQSGTKSTHNSGNLRNDLVAAFGVAVAGDVIVLADGTYSGALITCSRSGTATTDGSKHIMVRARTHGRATIALKLEVTGAYWWFTGLKLTFKSGANPNYQSYEQQFQWSAAGLWITNCWFTGDSMIKLLPSNAITNLRVCYNLIQPTPSATTATDTGLVLAGDFSNVHRMPPDSEIAWNKITLATRAADITKSRPIILIHNSHSMQADQASFVTQSFNFHHNHCVGAWAEAFYIKRNICLEYNYIEWTDTAAARFMITFRHGILATTPQYGIGGIVRGNRLKSVERAVISCGGTGNTIACNVVEGGGWGEIWLSVGNGAGGNFGTDHHSDGADNAQCVDNPGFTTVVSNTNFPSDAAWGETPNYRNGMPDNMRIYKGDTPAWNPTHARPQDSRGNTPPVATYINGYGTGNAAKVTTITVAALTGATPPVGCDVM